MARMSASALQRAVAEGRRSAVRYDIALPLRFAAPRRGDSPVTGSGESVNVSRTGLLFRCEGRLITGDALVVVLDWPVAAPDEEPLKLVVTGNIVRTRRGMVGMVLHTHRLLREHEIDKQISVFWGPAKATRRASRVAPVPMVLIEEADSVALLVSSIIEPQNWTVERADVETAKAIMQAGEPPISLLITRTPELLNSLKAEIPAILTVDENAADDESPQIGAHPLRVVVRRPLNEFQIRALIGILCAPATNLAEASSGSSGLRTHRT